MHKKLEADLISLAHSILQMKNKDNVFLLKQKSKEIYEKLSVLAFVEEYVNSTVNIKESKEELLDKVEKAFEKKDIALEEIVEENSEETVIHNLEDEYLEVDKTEILEQPFDELEEILASEPIENEETSEYLEVESENKIDEKVDFTKEEAPFTLEEVKKIHEENSASPTSFKDDPKDVGERNSLTLEEELQDTIPVDVMANLFEPAKPKSLNDRLSGNIQIGLNDRITFVKNLFEGSQEDFNRVVSQLNTTKTEKEAKKFINKMVKPDYNWTKHEELEARFMEIIERKFA
ncbi:hypothetical protein H9I45_13040 [Polaribacter haliotis]|uniref:Uncharacterized protein n=1 Tax=Polaribacter haliotis TaxID=1888915 RepID=A0A7L8AEI8_9FLAO|nr:hypothetical protein [Polaribacter haliotis]QOD60259.1 hypothetical protein H9I45_13040 [Polaribacter haliotis]